MRIVCTLRSAGVDHDVVIDGSDPTIDVVVASALPQPQPFYVFVDGHTYPSSVTLTEASVRDGAIVELVPGALPNGAVKPTPDEVGVPYPSLENWYTDNPSDSASYRHVELAALAGPLAGNTYPLDSGRSHYFGDAEEPRCTIGCGDHDERRGIVCRLARLGDTCVVVALCAEANVAVGNRRLQPNVAELLRMHDVFTVNDATFVVRPADLTRANITVNQDDGTWHINRPPRRTHEHVLETIDVPATPQPGLPPAFPWAQCLIPAAMAVVAAWLFHRPEVLMFAAMGPLLTVATAVANRRRYRAENQHLNEEHSSALAAATTRINASACRESEAARWSFPDAAAIVAIATRHATRVWERRADEDGAYRVRLGTHDRPANVAFSGRGTDEVQRPWLRDIPFSMSLTDVGVFGIAATNGVASAHARWLVAQLCTLVAPVDLTLVTLSSHPETWAWTKWLPHTRATTGDSSVWIGNTPESIDARLAEIIAILDHRQLVSRHASSNQEHCRPVIVIVFDGARELRDRPGVTRVLREGPELGIVSIVSDDDETRLAQECGAWITFDATWRTAVVHTADMSESVPIVPEFLDLHNAEFVARRLAPLRLVGAEVNGSIPETERLVDLLPATWQNPTAIANRWAVDPRNTDVVIGTAAHGPLCIDLTRDGPHALVAGTTGSGKSELLQTLIASLAFANRPDALNFVLIDFKGAAAFAQCEHLPHTVGLVTNLDEQLAGRALVSLEAELHRREHELGRIGASNISDAWRHHEAETIAAGLARLVIVIDEFAELVHELPSFVSGLIRIARVGRSLGIHLVLATQRPTGVITPEMRANTGLRIALRVEDVHDSNEVIDAPDAAHLLRSIPGRALVRLDGAHQLHEFQTARIAIERRQSGARRTIVTSFSDTECGMRQRLQVSAEASQSKVPTDLEDLTTHLRAAAALIDAAPTHRPLLPPLPDAIALADLERHAQSNASCQDLTSLQVAIGIVDRPQHQAQPTLVYDVKSNGHWLIAGASRSGRSNALCTIAAALAISLPVSMVHIHGFDFGGGALGILRALQHTGTIATIAATDASNAERLMTRLVEELDRRIARSSSHSTDAGDGDSDSHGTTHVSDDDPSTGPESVSFPYLIVLIDRWEAICTAFPPHTDHPFLMGLARLLRDGASVGVRVIAAGDRTTLIDRNAGQFEQRFVMALHDRNDYRLADIAPSSVPETMVPGRAIRVGSNEVVQFATLTLTPTVSAREDAIRLIADQTHGTTDSCEAGLEYALPMRLRPLPTHLTWTSLNRRAQTIPSVPHTWIPIGVAGDAAEIIGIDIDRHPKSLLAGDRRSGKTTALTTLAVGAAANGIRIVFVAGSGRVPSGLQGCRRVAMIAIDAATPESAAEDLRVALRPTNRRTLILVDDADGIERTATEDLLCEILSDATQRVAIVVAGTGDALRNSLRGLIPLIRRSANGMLLAPTSTLDGELIGIHLTRSQLGAIKGRAIIALNGEPIAAQIAIVANTTH